MGTGGDKMTRDDVRAWLETVKSQAESMLDQMDKQADEKVAVADEWPEEHMCIKALEMLIDDLDRYGDDLKAEPVYDGTYT